MTLSPRPDKWIGYKDNAVAKHAPKDVEFVKNCEKDFHQIHLQFSVQPKQFCRWGNTTATGTQLVEMTLIMASADHTSSLMDTCENSKRSLKSHPWKRHGEDFHTTLLKQICLPRLQVLINLSNFSSLCKTRGTEKITAM